MKCQIIKNIIRLLSAEFACCMASVKALIKGNATLKGIEL